MNKIAPQQHRETFMNESSPYSDKTSSPIKEDEKGLHEDSQTISFLRFPLIIGVVFLHTDLRVSCPDVRHLTVFGEFMALFNDFICGISVPLFFFISGYLFYKNWGEGAYPQKIKRRIKTIFVPYVLWILIYFIIVLVLQLLKPGFNLLLHKQISDFSLTDFLYIFWDIRQVTGLATDQAAPLVGQFWFLQCLMVMVILSPAIRLLVRRGGIITLLILFIAYATDPLPGAWFTINGLSFSKLTRNKTLPFLLLALLFYMLNRHVLPHETDCVYAIANIFLLSGILSLTKRMVSKGSWHIHAFLAGSSFFIFAIHRFFTALLTNGARLGWFPTDTSFAAMATYLLGTLAVVVCSLAVYLLMHRLFPKITSPLTGGR